MTDGESLSPQESPTEGGDPELLAELKRVGSDLGFRRWTRFRVKTVAILVLVDLLASGVSLFAVWKVSDVQHTGCRQDNELRQAYLDQWMPILDDAKTRDDPASRETVERFSKAFDAFALHDC